MVKHLPDIHRSQSKPALNASYGSREVLEFQIQKGATRGNRLVEAALPLLGLAVRVRRVTTDVNVAALLTQAKQESNVFERTIEGHGYDSATVLASRYVLCTMVDESVLSQEWGAESTWSAQPLLSHFHNETWGGEKFFAILERVKSEPEQFSDLLEFLYLCQALGFEGQYHVTFDGTARLQNLLNATRKALLAADPAEVTELFSIEHNISKSSQIIEWRFPIWGIPVFALLAMLVLFQVIDYRLDRRIRALANEARILSEQLNRVPNSPSNSQSVDKEVK